MELQNSNISLPFSNEIRQQGHELIQKVQDVISPVYPIQVKYATVAKQNANAATGSILVYTTPIDRDFYLTAAFISITKDVTSDCVECYLNASVGGSARRILNIDMQTATAGSFNMNDSYAYPIKIDRGTDISVFGPFAAGTLLKRGTIIGFIL
jgi:hypothetical protein